MSKILNFPFDFCPIFSQEMLSRSSLETQKLELMSIISDLKLQQASIERENMELRNNLHMNNNGDLKKPLLSRNSPQPHVAITTPQHSSSGPVRINFLLDVSF